MSTRQRPKSRAPEDRIVDLVEAGARVSYSPEYLRKLVATTNPPPLFKRRGQWHAWLSDLDEWAAARDGVLS